MKHLRKTLSLLLCLSFLCALPPAFSAQAAETGGYEETVLPLPEGYENAIGPAISPDGGFTVAARDTESQTWHLLHWQDAASQPDIVPLAFDGGALTGIDYAPDGGLLGYCDAYAYDPAKMAEAEESTADSGTETDEDALTIEHAFNSEDYVYHFFWFATDGSLLQHFEVNGMMSPVTALANQQVAAYDMLAGQLSLYDAQGKALVTESTDYPYAFAADAQTLYMLTASSLILYDPGTLQKNGEFSLSAAYGTQAYAAPDGLVYTLGSNGLQQIDPETGEVQLLDVLSGTLAGDPTNMLSGFGVLADGTVLSMVLEGVGSLGGGITYSNDALGGTLAAYTYNPDLDLGSRPDFRVISLYDNSLLRKAVSDFQRQHPELNVQLEVLLGDAGEDAALEDGIRTLNTQLLAGQGGDVMILDDLPMEKYINKGLLMDLSGKIDDSQIIPGILAGSRQADGGLYAVPTRFSTGSLWGKAELTDSIDSLASLAQLPLDGGQALLTPQTAEQWLRLFYPASEAAFRDETGALHFESQAFIDFLETLYALYNAQDTFPDDDTQAGQAMQDMMNGASALYPSSFSNLIDTAVSYSISGGEAGSFIPVPSVSGAGNSYTPAQVAGIYSGTQHPNAALDFLRLLLSDEMQALEAANGLPVTTDALDTQIANYERLRDEGGIIMVSSGDGNPIEVKQPQSHTWEKVRSLLMGAAQPYIPDSTLMGFIIEETEPFFSGQISAEQAAQALEQRAWSYMNE